MLVHASFHKYDCCLFEPILDADDYENSLNDKLGFEYTIGMLFDGYQVYRDLEKSPLSELATYYVYEDPRLNTFKESIDNEVLVSESCCWCKDNEWQVLTKFVF